MELVVACWVVVSVVNVVTDLDGEDEEVEAAPVELELELVRLLFWVDAVDDEEVGAVP